jgi:hypothetical protein
MFHDFRYPAILAASTRAAWQINDVIGPGAELDFARPFLPESLARTAPLTMIAGKERLALNHIRAHDYLCLFGLVEEFILPFLMDHIRSELPNADDDRVRAMLNFAAEEAKHIQLFKRFHEVFTDGFGTECETIGPPEEVAKVVLGHEPLSIALFILMIEWMTQSHYVGSVRADANLDPLFANLLRCHWIEEAQHAKLDTLIVEALAEGMSEEQLRGAVNGMIAICSYMDKGLLRQSKLNCEALQRATGRTFSEAERAELIGQQHQALRWTYIGSGMRHENFRATLGQLAPAELKRIDALAPSFC